MEKVLIVGPYNDKALAIMIDDLRRDFEVVHITDEADYPKHFDANYIILRTLRLPGDVIRQMPNLKFIQRWGAGVDIIDVETASQRNIPVANIAGANASAVAELALCLMLSVYRNVLLINKTLREGQWIKKDVDKISYTIDGKTVGIVGLGNIGRLVARFVTAMNAKVLYYDIRQKDDFEEKYPEVKAYQAVSLEELLERSDIVTLHVPLGDDTYHMIGRDEIARMREGTVLINTSRGGVVDESALIEALESKKLLGAGVDVYEKEPIAENYPLLQQPTVVGSCHVGGNTADLALKLAKLCPDNIRDARDGKLQARFIVNREKLRQ